MNIENTTTVMGIFRNFKVVFVKPYVLSDNSNSFACEVVCIVKVQVDLLTLEMPFKDLFGKFLPKSRSSSTKSRYSILCLAHEAIQS